MSYLIIKSLHVIFMVSWFAGLFYIFRLFVYNVANKNKPDVVLVLQLMQKKLLKIITIPASIITLGTGLLMIHMNPIWLSQGWLHLKLLVVLGLFGYQHFAILTHKRFLKGNYFLSERACRFINEVPTLVLFVAVFMVILKPF